MKAALCKSLDGPQSIVIEEIPDPVASEGEVVLRVKAAALNFFDTLVTRGKYQVKPDLPFSPCTECAGVIESLGPGVTGFKPGDRVIAYGGFGTAREKIAIRAKGLVAIPDGVSDEVAAGVTVTYGTSYYALKDRGNLKPGETLAVLGASGGVGLAAVELGKRMGARVVAAASTPEKLEICRQHGADVLINYEKEDLREALRKAGGEHGIDVVYDAVGDRFAEPAVRSMAWRGRYLVIGFAAGQIPKIPLNLVLLKSCDIVGVIWGNSLLREPHLHEANMHQLLAWLADGSLKMHIGATYPLERIVDGLQAFERREITGKAIVKI